MTLLTAQWAFYSKEPGDQQDYRILIASEGLGARPGDYVPLIRHYLPGNPPREAQITNRPEALPWTTIAPATIEGTDYLGVSIMDLGTNHDVRGRTIFPVRSYYLSVADVASVQPSYTSLAQAALLTPLRLKGTTPLSLMVEQLDTARLAERIDRAFGFDRVASQAALLLESPLALTNATALPRGERLSWLDAIMGLLPYGFRFDFSVSTWAHWDARRIRLNFGSRPCDGQQAVDWSRGNAMTAIKTDLAGEYLTLLLDLHRRHGTASLLTHLARPEVAVLRAGEPANAIYALRHFETPHLISLEPAMSGTPRQMRIGLWGATESGKTTYLAALRLATLTSVPDNKWRIEGVDDKSDDFLTDLTNVLMRGNFPVGTLEMTQYHWVFTGRHVSGAAVQFNLDSTDAPGIIYDDDTGRTHPEWQTMLTHLAECDGLVFLYDPLRSDSFQHIQRTITRLTRTMRESEKLVNEKLPHFVAICVTKFDDSRVFDVARSGNWVTLPNGTGMPVVAKPKEYFEHVAGRLVPTMLKDFFDEARLGFFVTSSIGFHLGPNGFDLDDYKNVAMQDGEPRIVGEISPINVLEPLLWLEEQIRTARDKRPGWWEQ